MNSRCFASSLRGGVQAGALLLNRRAAQCHGGQNANTVVSRRQFGQFRGSRPVATHFKTENSSSDAIAVDHPGTSKETAGNWDIRLLFDGECALCTREVEMLRGRDAGNGRIQFVDISSPDYDPQENAGVTYAEAMGYIHGILPDGSVVKNIEVFRRCYEAVGLGWVYAFTQYEPLRKLADAAYAVWAKNRLPLTGRGDLQVVLEKRRDQMDKIGCGSDGDTCELPWIQQEESKN